MPARLRPSTSPHLACRLPGPDAAAAMPGNDKPPAGSCSYENGPKTVPRYSFSSSPFFLMTGFGRSRPAKQPLLKARMNWRFPLQWRDRSLDPARGLLGWLAQQLRQPILVQSCGLPAETDVSARRANEWTAFQVLFIAWLLADQHDCRAARSLADHGLSRVPPQIAASARLQLCRSSRLDRVNEGGSRDEVGEREGP